VKAGTGKPPAAGGRTVGLDKPCAGCGKPVYYNYKSPVEGLCGRCADKSRRKKRPSSGRPYRPRGTASRGRRVWIAVAVTAAVGALLAHFLAPFLGF
jgi:hypothetical protein